VCSAQFGKVIAVDELRQEGEEEDGKFRVEHADSKLCKTGDEVAVMRRRAVSPNNSSCGASIAARWRRDAAACARSSSTPRRA
jgi:hypothetical protein